MLQFNEITLADRSWIQPLFEMSNFNSEEYSFTFSYLWRNVFQYTAARMGDYVIIKSKRDTHPPSYLFPAGSGDIVPVLQALQKDAVASEAEFVFHAMVAPSKKMLETQYPDQFLFLPLEHFYDYVYESTSLITLAGRKLHSKRNHINRFKENYPDWTYEPFTAENLPEVIQMNEEWNRINGQDADRSLMDETRSVREAIQDFFSLGMDGGLIRADGKVVAFSMGDRLNSDTYLVHIEKAFSDIQGAYAIINQQFAEHNCAQYRYINREDDSGEEGLRKAKLSYRPVFMVEKYAAKWIGEGTL